MKIAFLIVSFIVVLVICGIGVNHFWLKGIQQRELELTEREMVLKKHLSDIENKAQQSGGTLKPETPEPAPAPASSSVPAPAPAPSAVPAPVPSPASVPAYPNPPQAPANALASTPAVPAMPVDPDLERMRQEREMLEQQNRAVMERYNQVNGNGTSAPAATSTGQAPGSQYGELPKWTGNESPGAPGTSGPLPGTAPPAAMPASTQNSGLARQIRNATAIGRVVYFDPQWGIVEISAGKQNNIAVDQRLAVRRGDMIVGYLKVKEVGDTSSIASGSSSNFYSETAVKPQPGDDVIGWPLF